MIPIVWKEYTCTVSGGVYKFVECEKCNLQYVYRMVRVVQGQGNSLYLLDNEGAENRARQTADAELQKQLNDDCDPIACLQCGWYQSNMQAKMRSEHHQWLYWTGIGLYFPAVMLAVGGWLCFWGITPYPTVGVCLLISSASCVLAGSAAILWRKQSAGKFDPNSAPVKERIDSAAGKAQTRVEFERWLGGQGIQINQYTV